MAGVASRPREEAAVEEFLDAASHAPSGLLIEGEAGIGKTTLLSVAMARARVHRFRVLSTRAVAAESVSAYTALAELLTGIEPALWSDLPKPQRIAVAQILARTRLAGAATDQRAVAAAFLSIIERLVDDGPVLMAVDDLQWLEPSSVHVLAYTVRRLSGPVGVVGTVRTEDGDEDGSWLQMYRPDAVHRITLSPLSSRALHAVVMNHRNEPISQASMARIYEVSGGNPFYAIELARAFDRTVDKLLPNTLAELVRARIAGLDPAVHAALLAAASVAMPTVELVAAAAAVDHHRVVELLEAAEQQGIIALDGNRIRFTHPLLASGVYTNSSAEHRRAMHRRLADLVDEPERRARHLALSVTKGDRQTLQALDDAAAVAHARGAPAAAAELLELGLALGGDTADRRIRLAAGTFDAGDAGRARTLLESAIATMQPGPSRAAARFQLAVVRFMDDGYLEASQLLRRALDEDSPDGRLRVRVVITSAYALYMTGEPESAWRHAQQAVTHAERLGDPGLLSQALGVRATIQFFGGAGIDEPGMRRALELEDPDTFTPVMLRPSLERALMLACTGELDASYDQLREIRRRCTDRGAEGELIFVDFYVVVNRIWRGDLVEARRLGDDVRGLAWQLGAGFPAMLSLVLQAWLAVYQGSEGDARLAVADAIDASKRGGTAWHEDWTLTALGLLEVSLGNYEAAVNALEPLLFRHAPNSTEINAAAFVPDAVEALVALGRVDEAEPLVGALEANGRRLNRAWMSAVGGRGRAMVLAARGDLDTAVAAARRAMEHHDRLPMPFERARTLLLLGQLQRRQRDRTAARSMREALSIFEQLGTPLWADRARAQLSTADDATGAKQGLTESERRVAELAASGRTNREVADALFVSPKTVEATLARVYRKLGIRSRAELGQSMGRSAT